MSPTNFFFSWDRKKLIIPVKKWNPHKIPLSWQFFLLRMRESAKTSLKFISHKVLSKTSLSWNIQGQICKSKAVIHPNKIAFFWQIGLWKSSVELQTLSIVVTNLLLPFVISFLKDLQKKKTFLRIFIRKLELARNF